MNITLHRLQALRPLVLFVGLAAPLRLLLLLLLRGELLLLVLPLQLGLRGRRDSPLGGLAAVRGGWRDLLVLLLKTMI